MFVREEHVTVTGTMTNRGKRKPTKPGPASREHPCLRVTCPSSFVAAIHPHANCRAGTAGEMQNQTGDAVNLSDFSGETIGTEVSDPDAFSPFCTDRHEA